MNIFGLCSGSKGNCWVIKSENDFIIIDCGNSKKYLSQCFKDININYNNAAALLLTHGHKDHCSQIDMFNKVTKYSTMELNDTIKLNVYETVIINDFEIIAFPLSHDYPNTVGFIIKNKGETLVYVTDTGYVNRKDYEYLKGADYYIFESNHDIEMLMETSRPYYTKIRILGDSGHLSNEDCANVLYDLVNENTKEVFLAHISETANTYDLAYNVVMQKLGDKLVNCELKCAKQNNITYGGI